MKLRDERYWLGVAPWAFVPTFLVVLCSLAVLMEPLSLWLRLPVMTLLLWTSNTYVERSPWMVRWNRRWRRSRWGAGRPEERWH